MRSKVREARQVRHTNANEISAVWPDQRERAGRPLKHASKRPKPVKYSVRRHANRAQIEDDFLRSESSDLIAREYGVSGDSPANPHADATGFYERHRLISALDRSFLIDNENK